MMINLKFWLTLLFVAFFVQLAVGNGDLNPDIPLGPKVKKELKTNIKAITDNKLHAASSGSQVKTYVEDIGGGFRLDNQGRKDGKTHLAVQKNGITGRTTHAQVAIDGNPHTKTIRKGLEGSLRTGKVIHVNDRKNADIAKGEAWQQHQNSPEGKAAREKAAAIKKQREAKREARIASNIAKNKGDMDRAKPVHNTPRTVTKGGEERTRLTRTERTAARQRANENSSAGKQGGGKQAGGNKLAGGSKPAGGKQGGKGRR
ncbi:hypothetical protein BC829DRAFT_490110 [Chytridium lagenaria]|nr:hypothetical protein BC829DRAFT_490110 [Chytridium lagenaria]